MAALLIESGADVDAVDEDGNSALMLCVVCEHVVRTFCLQSCYMHLFKRSFLDSNLSVSLLFIPPLTPP